jgi:hypothetical protein
VFNDGPAAHPQVELAGVCTVDADLQQTTQAAGVCQASDTASAIGAWSQGQQVHV